MRGFSFYDTMNIMKRVFVVALILGVIAVVYLLFFNRLQSGIVQFPSYFPKEMITDPYLVDLIIDADEAKLKNEKHRVAVSYISHKTLAENLESFRSYFQANGFSLNTQENDEAQFVSAAKNSTSIGVTIWKRSPVQVSILYIINK